MATWPMGLGASFPLFLLWTPNVLAACNFLCAGPGTVTLESRVWLGQCLSSVWVMDKKDYSTNKGVLYEIYYKYRFILYHSQKLETSWTVTKQATLKRKQTRAPGCCERIRLGEVIKHNCVTRTALTPFRVIACDLAMNAAFKPAMP